ncbi:MAG: hypothetical protein U9P80_07320 [Thermodesulfobacteriota bacterium]|nr:hypothetical protein [Thermodesulfobacteriota bacterium]
MEDTGFDISGLAPQAAPVVQKFVRDVLSENREAIASVAVIGSAVTPDFIPHCSDINTVIVLGPSADMGILDSLASMGTRYGRKRVNAPLIMTKEYIEGSLDVFPIEFLDMKLFHHSVYGTDYFCDLDIQQGALRLQCERDLKSKLINLRQGYIYAGGKKKRLSDLLLSAWPGILPLVRAMILVVNGEIKAIGREETLKQAHDVLDMDMGCLYEIWEIKQGKRDKSLNDVKALFKRVYDLIDELSVRVDKISI